LTRNTSYIITIALLWVLVHSTDGLGATPEEQFQQAVALLNEGQFEDAVPILESVLKTYPEDPSALWNYGIAVGEIGAHEKAVSAWKRYRIAAPDDWRARAKLVQAYAAIGRVKDRDAERTSLFELRSSGKDPALSAVDRFCREQFRHNGQKFFVFEYFDPSGEWRVFYSFGAVNDAGEETFRISLGSYDSTNEIVWELGDLPRSKRLYHLDRYENKGHSTVHFYEFQPEYERVRSDVLTHLKQKTASE
jgi:tetratricopeptide (TPR) repeat protein